MTVTRSNARSHVTSGALFGNVILHRLVARAFLNLYNGSIMFNVSTRVRLPWKIVFGQPKT